MSLIDQKRPLSETSSRNALVKFDALLLKRFPEQLDGFDEGNFAEHEREDVKEIVELVEAA